MTSQLPLNLFEYEQRAKSHLSQMAFDYYSSGAWDEVTLRENRADDAVQSIKCGAKAIVVSNHGGRQLDGAIASIEALPDVVAAVDNQIFVLVDGGIRRGVDIIKALAYGADCVLIGRPILWGLALNGKAGVTHVLELLRTELDLAMALSGCTSIQDIDASLIR
jgi:4-hydroxymandelate oxidase